MGLCRVSDSLACVPVQNPRFLPGEDHALNQASRWFPSKLRLHNPPRAPSSSNIRRCQYEKRRAARVDFVDAVFYRMRRVSAAGLSVCTWGEWAEKNVPIETPTFVVDATKIQVQFRQLGIL